MSDSYELVIRDLLKNEKDSRKLAAKLFERISSASPSQNELAAFLNFLILAGFRKSAIEIMGHLFRDGHTFNIISFCYTLNRSGFKPGQEFLNQLKNANQELATPQRLTHFSAWEAHDPDIKELRVKTIEALRNANRDQKEKYLAKLEYFRNSRMIDEEAKLLRELVEIYPDEKDFQVDQQNFAERWAREILSKHNQPQSHNIQAEEINASATLPEDEQKIVNVIVGEMQLQLKSKPDMAYNFAILLYFLDSTEEALYVLNSNELNHAADWLKIELLIKCRRYVECLEALSRVERIYADDPETTFGATYYRAIALYFIGQKNSAIELLRSIVQIRPNYRSAHSFLMKWGGQA